MDSVLPLVERHIKTKIVSGIAGESKGSNCLVEIKIHLLQPLRSAASCSVFGPTNFTGTTTECILKFRCKQMYLQSSPSCNINVVLYGLPPDHLLPSGDTTVDNDHPLSATNITCVGGGLLLGINHTQMCVCRKLKDMDHFLVSSN